VARPRSRPIPAAGASKTASGVGDKGGLQIWSSRFQVVAPQPVLMSLVTPATWMSGVAPLRSSRTLTPNPIIWGDHIREKTSPERNSRVPWLRSSRTPTWLWVPDNRILTSASGYPHKLAANMYCPSSFLPRTCRGKFSLGGQHYYYEGWVLALMRFHEKQGTPSGRADLRDYRNSPTSVKWQVWIG